MPETALPAELVQQFRVVAQGRLDRVENAWTTVLRTFDDESATVIHRELHTLKGESRMLGFGDVNLVCHKLEDLFEVARARGFAVDDEIDLAVNMAIRFMGMLVRKKVGSQLSGIDLPGFLKQIETITAEAKVQMPMVARTTTSSSAPIKVAAPSVRVPHAVREKLAPVAVDMFIEYALAQGARRDRLRASWHELRELISIHRAALGAAQLEKHRGGVVDLARDLGKQVDVTFEVDTVEATAEVLATVDTAALHLLRNAIDHGLEPPDERVALGKPAKGTVTVTGGVRDGRYVASIEDDGRGVSLDDVRARAFELGLIDGGSDVTDRWLDLVCQPGFSTRAQATDVSGRGIGLDVVRAGIIEAGGTFTGVTRSGAGTTWTISLPLPRVAVDGRALRVPGISFPVVIDAEWKTVPRSPGVTVIDLAAILGLPAAPEGSAVMHFTRAGRTLGLVIERDPVPARARYAIETAAPVIGSIVMIESAEALFVHLERAAAKRP
jgi:two-component system chemotaxis sensor kinase CheA